MVRATIFVSALFALVATVAAVPRPASPLVDVDAGDHIGTGDLNFDEALQNVVNANDLRVKGKILYTLPLFYIYSYFLRCRL